MRVVLKKLCLLDALIHLYIWSIYSWHESIFWPDICINAAGLSYCTALLLYWDILKTANKVAIESKSLSILIHWNPCNLKHRCSEAANNSFSLLKWKFLQRSEGILQNMFPLNENLPKAADTQHLNSLSGKLCVVRSKKYTKDDRLAASSFPQGSAAIARLY